MGEFQRHHQHSDHPGARPPARAVHGVIDPQAPSFDDYEERWFAEGEALEADYALDAV